MLRSWLYSLLASGCVCSLLLLVNTEGKSKNLIETACACVMLLTFLSPFDTGMTSDDLHEYFRKWTSVEARITSNQNYDTLNKS